jgi:hypothetical protein
MEGASGPPSWRRNLSCQPIGLRGKPDSSFKETIMKNIQLKLIALSIGLAFVPGAAAETMSKDDYKAGEAKIAADYKAARAACGAKADSQNDICVAEAKGKERVALAELEASYKPSRKAHYEVQVVRPKPPVQWPANAAMTWPATPRTSA